MYFYDVTDDEMIYTWNVQIFIPPAIVFILLSEKMQSYGTNCIIYDYHFPANHVYTIFYFTLKDVLNFP